MHAFFPDLKLFLIWLIFTEARFENQRWAKARTGGLEGSSKLFGIIVDATFILGTIYSYAFLFAYGFDVGWKAAVGLYLLVTAIGLIIVRIGGPDKLWKWVAGTILVWVGFFVLIQEVSWFGLIHSK